MTFPKRPPRENAALEPVPLARLGYRVNDFCTVTGIGRSALYGLMREGKIKTVRLAGRRIIPAAEAERLINEGA